MTYTPISKPTGLDDLAPIDRRAAEAFLQANPAGAGAPLAVVIPAFDEAPTVAAVIDAVPSQVAALATDVIVVVDGATDATAAVAAEAGARVCEVAVNRGQGAALALGYWLARARGSSLVATLDADGQYEPLELERLIAPILAGEADFVTGSRRLGNELTTDRIRHAGVIAFAALISALIAQRVTDPACGLRAMRVEVTAAVKLEQPQYQASELLIAAALSGFRIAEVPTTMRDRAAGSTRTKKGGNFGYGVRFARAVFSTWRRDRKLGRAWSRAEKIHNS